MIKNFTYLLIFLLTVCGISSDEKNYGPFYQRVETDSQVYTRILGPLYESIQIKEDGKEKLQLEAYRPFYSFVDHPESELKLSYDYLWPLGDSRHISDQIRTRFLLAGKTRRFKHGEDHSTPYYQSRWLAPFYWQTDVKDNENSFMLFPFYGDISNSFGFKKLDFTMFPFYITSQRGRQNSEHIFWPFYMKMDGGDLHQRRYFPFYGWRQKDNKYRQEFYLWPFYHKHKSLDPKEKGESLFIFPFWGESNYHNTEVNRIKKGWSVFWPFITHYTTIFPDKPEKNSEQFAIWPFYHHDTTTDKKTTQKKYFWPLYGEKKRENYSRRFVMWPLGHQWTTTSPNDKSSETTTIFFPFVYEKEQLKEEKTVSKMSRCWPLFKRLQTNGHSAVHIPALVPFHVEEIERNYSPLWTFFSSLSTPDEYRNEILWGLWQYENRKPHLKWQLFPLVNYFDSREKDHSKFSILKGLFGWEKTNGKNTLQLFWKLKF